MGLDVYLYNGDCNLHFGDKPDDPKNEHGYRDHSKWWESPERVHAKSQRYPEHLCERTYLRSSYNSGGYDTVVGNLIGKDWYYVFGPRITEGEASPYEDEDEDGGIATERMTTTAVKSELTMALVRAREVTEAVKAVKHPLRVMTEAALRIFDQRQPSCTAADAIRITNKAMDRERGALGGAYSNRDGTFLMDTPLEVLAVIPGKSVLNEPALHLVYRFDISWYVQASEITEEFIEYALTLDDPRISWSG